MRLFWNLEIYYMNTFNIYSNTGEEKKIIYFIISIKSRGFFVSLSVFLFIFYLRLDRQRSQSVSQNSGSKKYLWLKEQKCQTFP